MRNLWLMGLLIAGCGFSAVPETSGNDDEGAPPGPGNVAPWRCDIEDSAQRSSVRVCLTFDEQPLVQDVADSPHNVTRVENVTAAPHEPGSAAVMTALSRIHLEDKPDLDVSELGIDLWLAPSAGSSGHRTWLLDNNWQYYVTYESDGRLRCGIGPANVTSATKVPLETWHHVACTYGADRVLRIYVDGNLESCSGPLGGIPKQGTDGLVLGANYSGSEGGAYRENYVGSLDSVRLYASALTPAQVCAAAHKTGCQDRCPGI